MSERWSRAKAGVTADTYKTGGFKKAPTKVAADVLKDGYDLTARGVATITGDEDLYNDHKSKPDSKGQQLTNSLTETAALSYVGEKGLQLAEKGLLGVAAKNPMTSNALIGIATVLGAIGASSPVIRSAARLGSTAIEKGALPSVVAAVDKYGETKDLGKASKEMMVNMLMSAAPGVMSVVDDPLGIKVGETLINIATTLGKMNYDEWKKKKDGENATGD